MPSISLPLALGIGAGVSGAAALGGAALQSGAAQSAAQTQASASEQAAQLQYQAQQQALAQQQAQFNVTQANEAPFIQAGQGAVNNLSALLGTRQAPNTTGALTSAGPTQQYATPFQAPTAAQAAATPGYQFTLQQGEQALQRSAAATGNLLTGGTAKDIANYAEGLASTNYQQTYENALNQYQQNYNIFQQNQANQYNRLANVAGLGQVSTGQLGQIGAQTTGQEAQTLLGGSQGISQALQNAAAATASGYVGSANAYSGAINNVANSAALLPLLTQGYNGASVIPAGSQPVANPGDQFGYNPLTGAGY